MKGLKTVKNFLNVTFKTLTKLELFKRRIFTRF